MTLPLGACRCIGERFVGCANLKLFGEKRKAAFLPVKNIFRLLLAETKTLCYLSLRLSETS
jgi:hypothetical protein